MSIGLAPRDHKRAHEKAEGKYIFATLAHLSPSCPNLNGRLVHKFWAQNGWILRTPIDILPKKMDSFFLLTSVVTVFSFFFFFQSCRLATC